ncbi:leucine-rich repeat-containing protein 15-like [Calliphora vicina]|uniref:leucine-rich repeat-containing protein 15-like n=1 Tax=Calliphora vicina TaxID=7373 RepID=UPI00325BAB2B
MKGLKILFMVILVVKAIKTETEAELQDEEKDQGSLAQSQQSQENEDQQSVSVEDGNEDNADDKAGRNLTAIQLYTDDERCNDIGVCSGMDYGDKSVVVTFDRKSQIRFTSENTYKIKEANYFTLTFVNSKFANFPLNLFYAFKVQELDFRNCSLETLKWDNFLKADNLSILLLSENLLTEIKPMLFSYVDNLSFLFLDSNRLSMLYNDSFKGLGKLNFLDLHNNLIETLPSQIFSYMPGIQQINLAGNRLKIIQDALFAENPRLFSLHLQQNELTEIQEYAFQEQNILKYLDVSHNTDLETLVCGNVKVENLWAKNCSLYRVNIYGEAVHVDLQQNNLKELYFSQPEYLETLRLKDNELEQISSLALTTNLRTFDVSNNPGLKTLPDLWQINSLERLDLSNTSLKEIPITVLASPHKLRSLNVSFNQLQEINPLNFKYFEKLSQFYIHENNWNCYNLQMLMDMVIKPLRISYTHDEYDSNFPGEYIQGIKCMYRLEPLDDEYYVDSLSSQQLLENNAQEVSNISPSNIQEYNQLNFEHAKEMEKLRREFKTIFGIYEQKFALVMEKLNDIDMRLKSFERFNKTLWQQVSIVV